MDLSFVRAATLFISACSLQSAPILSYLSLNHVRRPLRFEPSAPTFIYGLVSPMSESAARADRRMGWKLKKGLPGVIWIGGFRWIGRHPRQQIRWATFYTATRFIFR